MNWPVQGGDESPHSKLILGLSGETRITSVNLRPTRSLFFLARMPRHNYPLVIVDVQAAFMIPPKTLAAIERYSRQFERRIFTRFVVQPDSVFRQVLGNDCCAPGSPDLRLLIEPSKKDIVFDKQGYGLSAKQIQRLRQLRIQEVMVCGMDTDACVLATMFTLIDGGIAPRVAPARYCHSNQNLDTEARTIMRSQFPKLHANF
jgi:nicotinamidase-related amidase